MTEFGLPALFALFVWWFSTGVIIYLDGLPKHTFRWSMLGATAVFAISLYGLAVSSADASLSGAYIAFSCGLLAWGWQEISFYMDYVTGPRKEACPEGCGGWRHFVHAIQTSLYHELAIIASAIAVFALTWDQPNQVGTWTFMVLWWMHQSAKLNVFLGVRNLNEELLPEHLDYLKSFLRKRSMNLLFPLSVTVSSVITVFFVQQAMAPGASSFEAAGFTFLATLMALAILEHWFLVLPLPAASLWKWGLRSRGKVQPFDVDVIAGFLGAGKTTFLRRSLATIDANVRTVALVNDFGELGVDGSLLGGHGADVVELPNGCICCSLRNDLGAQLKEVVGRLAPERILIEPSGVADITALLGVLNGPELRPLIKGLRTYAVIDAGAFLRDYARMQEYFDAQARLAPVFIVNKTDLVSPGELETVKHTLRGLNPDATIVNATFGKLQGQGATESAKASALLPATLQDKESDDQNDTANHHQDAALGLASWSVRLAGQYDPQGLRDVLDAVSKGAFGHVDRVKGIAQAGSGWVRFDVAGGRPSMMAFAPVEREDARVVAIGRAVDEERLRAAFVACAMPSAA